MTPGRILVIGFGNPGRLDDGLGPALVRELAARGVAGVSLESGYQLQIEDAALLAEHDVVVFVDADTGCGGPFEVRCIEPRPETAFTTHSVAPEALLALAHEHFGAMTLGFVLGIRGYEFDEFGEELSLGARRNLAAATDFMDRALRDGSFATEAVSFAVREGLDVMYVTEDTIRSSPEHLRLLLTAAIEAGAKRVCLCDTVGAAVPEGVMNLVGWAKNLLADDIGGTMRLGQYRCELKKGSVAHQAYRALRISERHRHRYEFNPSYMDALAEAGLVFSGVTPDYGLVEIVEAPDHPWFLGCQFHPEFKSKPLAPHPLFKAFIGASYVRRRHEGRATGPARARRKLVRY